MRISFFCSIFVVALNATIIFCVPNQDLNRYVLLLNGTSDNNGTQYFKLENPAFCLSFPNWKVPNENSDTMSIINTLFGTNNIAITDWIESLKIEITDNGINKFVNNAFFTIDKEESVTWLNTLKNKLKEEGFLDRQLTTKNTFFTIFIVKKSSYIDNKTFNLQILTVYNVKPEINNVLQDHIQSLLLCFDKKTLKSKKVVYAWPLTKNQTSDIWVVKSLFNKCSEALVNRIKDRLLRKPIESCYIYWVSVEKDEEEKKVLAHLKYSKIDKDEVYADVQNLVSNLETQSSFHNGSKVIKKFSLLPYNFDKLKAFENSISMVPRQDYKIKTSFDSKVNDIVENSSDLSVVTNHRIKFKTIVVIRKREIQAGNLEGKHWDAFVTTELMGNEDGFKNEEALAFAHAASLLSVFAEQENPDYFCDHNQNWTMARTQMIFQSYDDYVIRRELIFSTQS